MSIIRLKEGEKCMFNKTSKQRMLEDYIERRIERSRRSHTKKVARIHNILIIGSIIIFIFLIVLGQVW